MEEEENWKTIVCNAQLIPFASEVEKKMKQGTWLIHEVSLLLPILSFSFPTEIYLPI